MSRRQSATICGVCASVEMHTFTSSYSSDEARRVFREIAAGRAKLRVYVPKDKVSTYADLMPAPPHPRRFRLASTTIDQATHDRKWYASIVACDGNTIAIAGPFDTREDACAALHRCVDTRTIIGAE